MAVTWKKVNELSTTTPALTDIALSTDIANPTILKRSTWQGVRDLFGSYFATDSAVVHKDLTEQIWNWKSFYDIININSTWAGTNSIIRYYNTTKNWYVGLRGDASNVWSIADESAFRLQVTDTWDLIVWTQNWTSAWSDFTLSFWDLGSMTITDIWDARKYSRYKQIGKTVTWQFAYVVTIGGTVQSSFSIPLPVNSRDVRISGVCGSLGAASYGFLSSDDVNTKVYVRQYDNANFPSGAQWITGAITYEV